jgi:hypothetical protein
MSENTQITAALLWLALVATCFYGWVNNVIKFVAMLGGDITAMFAARALGIVVAPLGTVLGFM